MAKQILCESCKNMVQCHEELGDVLSCQKGHWQNAALTIDYESFDPPDFGIWDDCKDFDPISTPVPATD